MTRLTIGLLAATTALIAVPAAAQTTTIASVDPTAAILSAKAIGPAWVTITNQYKAAYDAAAARQRTLQTTVTPLLAQLDTNKDGSVDATEAAAAQTAKRPVVQQIEAAQQAAEADIGRTLQPARLAQAWAIDQAKLKYAPALQSVITAKRIGLVVNSDAINYADPNADISDEVAAAINTALPTVTTTPPAGWQPDQQTVALYERAQQALSAQARAAAQPTPAAAAGTRPAGTPAPAAGTTPRRDRNGDPIK